MTLFVVGAINENYPNKNNPFSQFKFQKVYKFLKISKTKTVIKLPQIFENIKYPYWIILTKITIKCLFKIKNF